MRDKTWKEKRPRTSHGVDLGVVYSTIEQLLGDTSSIPASKVFSYQLDREAWSLGVAPWHIKDGFLRMGALVGHITKGEPTIALPALAPTTNYFDIDIDLGPDQPQSLERILEAFGAEADKLLLLFRKGSGGLSLLGRLNGLMRPGNGGYGYNLSLLQDDLKAIMRSLDLGHIELYPSPTMQRRIPFQGGQYGQVLVDPHEYLNKWAPALDDYCHLKGDEAFYSAIGGALVNSTSNVIRFPVDRTMELATFIGSPPVDLHRLRGELEGRKFHPCPAPTPGMSSPLTPPTAPSPKAPSSPPPVPRASTTTGSPKKSSTTAAEGRSPWRYPMDPQRLWDVGLEGPSTRNQAVLVLATHCFNSALSLEEAQDKISGWFTDGKTNGFSKDYLRDSAGTIKRARGSTSWVYERLSRSGLKPRIAGHAGPMPLTVEEFRWLYQHLTDLGLTATRREDRQAMNWIYEFYQAVKLQLLAAEGSRPGAVIIPNVQISAARLRKLKYGSGGRYLAHLDRLEALVKCLKGYSPGSSTAPGVASSYRVVFKQGGLPGDEPIPMFWPFRLVLKRFGCT